MAKLIQNVVMQGVSGKVGKTLVFRQMADGKTVIALRPKPRTAPVSPAEEASRQRFKEAAHIAKKRAQDPILRPQYLARAKPGQSAYLVALKEYLNQPKHTAIINKPPTQEVQIEIAKLNLLAINNLLTDQSLASFAQRTLNNAQNRNITNSAPRNTPQSTPTQKTNPKNITTNTKTTHTRRNKQMELAVSHSPSP